MSRLAVGLILMMALAVGLSVYAGGGSLGFFTLVVTDGAAALLWTAGVTALGFVVLRWTGFGDEAGAAEGALSLHIATSGAVGLGLTSLAALGLGLLGWLNRPAALLLGSVGPLLLAFDLLWRFGNPSLENANHAAEAWLRDRPGRWWVWAAILPLAALCIASAALPPGMLWPQAGDPHPYDVLEYHLQGPREWYELGRIVPLKHNVYTFFPFNVEMQYLLAMHLRGGPWAGMYMAHFLSLSHMALAAVALYGTAAMLARERKRCAGAMAALGMAASPWAVMLGTIAYNESGLLLYGSLALAWALRAVGGERKLHRMALAGAMAGLACGTKYTGVPIVLIGAPVAWGVVMLRSRRGVVLPILAYLAMGMAMFSPWLVRNFAWTGNPVFPEAMPLLGQGHFSPVQVDRWERAHRPTEGQQSIVRRLEAFRRQVLLDWRYGFALWPGAVGAIACGWRRREVWMLAIVLAALAVFWLGFTHLQSRFFVLGIPAAAVLIGLLAARGRTAAAGVVIVGAIAAVSLVRLNGIVYPLAWGFGQRGLFLVQDLSPITPDFVADEARLALVGDAKAFLYSRPMSRLRYRTVFDVNGNDGRSPLDAWLGGESGQVQREWFVLVFPGELKRFADSYHAVPVERSWLEQEVLIALPPMGDRRP